MYVKKLFITYPGAQWAMTDNSDFSTLNWLDDNSDPKPTLDDLEARFKIKAVEHAINLLRQQRDSILHATDRYGLSDYPFENDNHRQEWLSYRKQLRDITSTCIPKLTSDCQLDENSFRWPTKPSY